MQISCDEALCHINSIEFRPIIARLIKKQKWSESQALKAIVLYKRFLLLTKKHKDLHIIPSLEIDEVWHEHILLTKQYHYDCQNIFGSYFHHDPEDANAPINIDVDLAFEKTQKLYYEEYGEPLDTIMPLSLLPRIAFIFNKIIKKIA
jgi:hypothetical protein